MKMYRNLRYRPLTKLKLFTHNKIEQFKYIFCYESKLRHLFKCIHILVVIHQNTMILKLYHYVFIE